METKYKTGVKRQLEIRIEKASKTMRKEVMTMGEERIDNPRVLVRLKTGKTVWNGGLKMEKLREQNPTLTDLEMLEAFVLNIRVCFLKMPKRIEVEYAVLRDASMNSEMLLHGEYIDTEGVITNQKKIETLGWKYLGYEVVKL